MRARKGLVLLLLLVYGLLVYWSAPSPAWGFVMAVFPGVISFFLREMDPATKEKEGREGSHEPITLDSFTLFSRTRPSVSRP